MSPSLWGGVHSAGFHGISLKRCLTRQHRAHRELPFREQLNEDVIGAQPAGSQCGLGQAGWVGQLLQNTKCKQKSMPLGGTAPAWSVCSANHCSRR